MIMLMLTAFILLKLSIYIFSIINDKSELFYRIDFSLSMAIAALKFPIFLASGKQFRRHFWRAFPCLSLGGIKRIEIGGTAANDVDYR